MTPLIWQQQPCDGPAAEGLQRALGIEPITARLLCLRGLDTPELAARFLKPSLDHLLDPYGLADMRPAVERLLGAVSRRERIAVHGDYDVDGITSTVILRRCLELLGGDVVHFIPERLKDGYGLLPVAIERLHQLQGDADAGEVLVGVGAVGPLRVDDRQRGRQFRVGLVMVGDDQIDAELAGAPSRLRSADPAVH